MDTERLEIFSDIAETHNFTLTAERMGYTQSGVSHAMSKLESDMRLSLLHRTNRGVALTRDGEAILPYVRLAISRFKLLKETVDSLHGLERGQLSIGTYSSSAILWLPMIISQFQKLHPNIKIYLREGGVEEINRWIEEGIVDFGFISWQERQALNFISLARDPMYIITSNDFELPNKYNGRFPVEHLLKFRFIASEAGIDCDVSSALRHYGIKPTNWLTCKDDHTIIALVSKGVGISLLSGMILNGYENDVQLFQPSSLYERTMGISLKSEKNLTNAAKAFISLSRKIIAEMNNDKII